jgi:type II restriction/modification system DNA methylase subunit YeeA
VRYLVENSLGRLWLLNRPARSWRSRWTTTSRPNRAETDFLRIGKPEEIKICDPACGSGHMLTYAFDLLYAIYEEEGYEPAEIPEKILTHNLYGIEIDERAGELAAFALTMKAMATVAMITMQSWMFLSSFEALRSRILNQHTILTMAHLGARAFDSIGGEVVSTTAFVLENTHKPNYRGAYMRLVDGNSEAEKMEMMAKAITQSVSQ